MNNEFKHGIQGLMIAIGFFVAVKILFFFILISPQKEEKEISIDIDYKTTSQPYTSTGPDGKALFSQNCASCHAVNKQLTGPALAGVLDRVSDRKLLNEWIRDNEKVLNPETLILSNSTMISTKHQ